MENQLKVRRVRSLHSLVQVGATTRVIEAMEQVLDPVEKVGKFHSHKTLATNVERADIRRTRIAKLWMQCAEVVAQKVSLRKSVLKLNVSYIHLKFHKLPPVLQGRVTLSTLMTVASHCLLIWSVF